MSETRKAPSKRPGQIRFEAWVPEDLFRHFAELTPNRKAWLVAKMREAVANGPKDE
jgi:hypothetical protein